MIITKTNETTLSLKDIAANLPSFEESETNIVFINKKKQLEKICFGNSFKDLEKKLKYLNKNEEPCMLYLGEGFRKSCKMPFLINAGYCFAYEGYLTGLISDKAEKTFSSIGGCFNDFNNKAMDWIFEKLLTNKDSIILMSVNLDGGFSFHYYNNHSRYTYNGLQVSRYDIPFFTSNRRNWENYPNSIPAEKNEHEISSDVYEGMNYMGM